MKPGVSVIICCYNSENRLPPTLSHIQAQQVPDTIDWELILVDNASKDGTRELAEAFRDANPELEIKVVFEGEPGLSNARHKGLSEAQYSYICFSDDDNWLDPEYVQTVFGILDNHPEVAVCGGESIPVFEEGNTPPSWFEAQQAAYACGKQGEEEGYVSDKRGYLFGAGISFRKSALDGLVEAGFRPMLSGRKGKKLSAGEDSELCFALRGAGWKLWYSPRLRLQHYMPPGRLNWDYLIKMEKGFGASTVAFDPYRHFLTQDEKVPPSWESQMITVLRQLLRFHIHPLLLIFRRKEGRNLDRFISERFGRLTALWAVGRREYKARFKEVKSILRKAARQEQ
jgi:glycosyltransferase involved in cell wall biosynthesis